MKIVNLIRASFFNSSEAAFKLAREDSKYINLAAKLVAAKQAKTTINLNSAEGHKDLEPILKKAYFEAKNGKKYLLDEAKYNNRMGKVRVLQSHAEAAKVAAAFSEEFKNIRLIKTTIRE